MPELLDNVRFGLVSYPVVMNLDGRLGLVVGGGAVARRKVMGLLEAGGRVRLVAPEAVEELESLARAGRIEWRARAFEPADLAGCWLVIAATDDEAVNRAVFEAAEASGVWCNVADRPELCSFILPAHFRRGRLVVAVSTGGASPLLAGRIRDDLAEGFDQTWSDYLELLARIRRAVLGRGLSARGNRAAFEAVLEADLLTPLRQGDRQALEERLRACCRLSLADLEPER